MIKDNNQLISIQYAKIFWQNKNILIRNVILAAIVVSVYSLIMPKTFQSTAVLMPPKSDSDNSVISQIGEITIGNFLDDGANNESNTIFAILKSRTMAESVINELNLNNIKSEGYSFQIELNYLCFINKFKIEEIPIIFYDRTVGESKMSTKIIIEAILKVPTLRLKRIFRIK